jgi:DegV family protein with EDD domain
VSGTAIVTDSTADLPSALAAEQRITVIPLTLNLDGRSYADGVDITPGEFYTKLAHAGGHPTTSQPTPAGFEAAYRELLEDHDEVVSIHISEKLSGTLRSAQLAAEAVDPERIHAVDSEFASMPLAALTLVAAAVAARGGRASEVLAEVARVREAMRCYFAVATLEYLRRGGRIGAASALLGSVLQIKPILALSDGQVAPLERVRTSDRALGRIVELGAEVDRGGGLCLVVGHAAAEDAALAIAERLERVAETLIVQPLGPVVGAHAGPGTVGLAAYPAELFPLGLRHGIAASAGA